MDKGKPVEKGLMQEFLERQEKLFKSQRMHKHGMNATNTEGWQVLKSKFQ